MERGKIIDEIIQDLENLKIQKNFENQYAIEENIIFFKAIKLIFTDVSK